MSYWQQRDITNRLIAARHERQGHEGHGGIDDLLEQLAPHIVMAIANDLNDGGLITQTPIWMDE